MAGQEQVSLFGHVETTGGVGQADIPVGESWGRNTLWEEECVIYSTEGSPTNVLIRVIGAVIITAQSWVITWDI